MGDTLPENIDHEFYLQRGTVYKLDLKSNGVLFVTPSRIYTDGSTIHKVISGKKFSIQTDQKNSLLIISILNEDLVEATNPNIENVQQRLLWVKLSTNIHTITSFLVAQGFSNINVMNENES